MPFNEWMQKWFGAPRQNGAAAAAVPARAPCAWHDDIAHTLLPRLLLAEADHLLGDDRDPTRHLGWLYAMFEAVGRHHGLGFDQAMDAADATRLELREADGLRIAAIVMPPAEVSGEAHMVLLTRSADGEARCYALDRADDGTLLVALGPDGLRTPLGPGPAPDLDAMISAIAAHGGA